MKSTWDPETKSFFLTNFAGKGTRFVKYLCSPPVDDFRHFRHLADSQPFLHTILLERFKSY